MSNTPVGYDSKTPYAAVKLTLPQAIKTTPALHAALYADTVRDLKQFEEGAQAEADLLAHRQPVAAGRHALQVQGGGVHRIFLSAITSA